MNFLEELDNFINQTKESKEIKRALAVKMILSGKSYHEVKALLKVSHSFISQWKNKALFHGVESLRLQYQGRKGYLQRVEKEKTIEWLRAQDYLKLSDLKNYLQKQYDVVFESNQSYYSLLKEAEINWKKTQKKNPAKNDELVNAKKVREDKLAQSQPEIEPSKLAVYD